LKFKELISISTNRATSIYLTVVVSPENLISTFNSSIIPSLFQSLVLDYYINYKNTVIDASGKKFVIFDYSNDYIFENTSVEFLKTETKY